jgi:hypothetical protein
MGTTRFEIVMENAVSMGLHSCNSDAAQLYCPWRVSFYAIIEINTTTNITLTIKDTEYILQYLHVFLQANGVHK